MSTFRSEQLRQPLSLSGSFTGSLAGTASWAQSSSFATTASYAANAGSGVSYITSSGPFSLTGIEVADYSNDVAVTFINGALKFIFGTPLVPSTPTLSFGTGGNAFETDRFNKVLDAYVITGSFAVNGYTLVSASLYTGSTLLAQIGTGALLTSSLTTSGSQVYRLEVTSSSPLNGTFATQSVTLNGTLAKTIPDLPTITISPVSIQLGVQGNQIEQGATGSISFSSAYAASDAGWTRTSLVNIPATSPIIVTGASSDITITATANYSSPGTDNVPTRTLSRADSRSIYKIISVRYGASAATSYTQAQLENLALWDTTLGGTIGTISKGTTNPNTYQFTVVTSGNYIYIVIDSSYTLIGILNVNNSRSNDINVFTRTVVGPYAIYRSNAVSATTILYELAI